MSAPADTTPIIAPRDIVFYFSGGYYNKNPRYSLGGEPSSFPVVSGSLNGVFDRVTTPEAKNGDTEYRCIYLKNTNQTRKLLKTKIWVETSTPSPRTSVAVSIGSAGVNGIEPAIPNEGVAPPMQFFAVPYSQPDSQNIGDLYPGDTIGLWIRWKVNSNTTTTENDYCVLRVDGEREPESISSPLPPPEEPPPEGCPSGYHWDPVSQQCVQNTVPIVCPIGWHYNETTQRCVPDYTPPPSIPMIKFGAVSDTVTSDSSTGRVFDLFRTHLDTTSTTEPSFLLTGGDSTHSDGNVEPFIDFCRGLGTMFPNNIFPVLGNHDDGEDGASGDGQDIIDAFPAMGPDGYYTVTRKNIKIICMNTQADYDEGSAQHTFVMAQLQQADADPNIKWIIITFHKPIMGTAGYHAFLSDLRSWLFPAADQYHVDLIMSGHNHVYYRTKPVKYNSATPATPTIVSTQANGNYINQDGRIFVGLGTGGRTTNVQFDSDTAEPWIGYRYEPPPFGACIFTLQDNGNQIAAEHRTIDNQIDDSWIISKPGASPPPPTEITCPQGYHWNETLGRCVQSPQSCPTGQHWDEAQQKCVPDVVVPPPPTDTTYPVANVEWYYDSAPLLAEDDTISAGSHGSDGILLSSGASGVNSCEIRDGWLYIQTGGGNGRVYWDYHLLPRFDQDDQPGFNIAVFFKFRWIDNESISVKDGNHGTDGWSLEGDLVFGGFGYSFHETDAESRAEYWHNNQGDEIMSVYPGNRRLEVNGEYKSFATIQTDRVAERVVLNAWIDFNDGTGWTKVLNDRVWMNSNWNPGSVPSGDDQAQIENGPSYIKRHHLWTRNNVGSSGNDLPITGLKIGTLPFLS